MNEKEVQLKKEASEYEDIIDDNLYDLEKAHMALELLLNEYHWRNKPDAREAVKYASSLNADNVCSENEKHSWEYVNGYEKIMWLASVARDYCSSALKSCNSAYWGGACNE